AGRGINEATSLSTLIALDVDFHRAIYRLSGNTVIEETVAPQWPHMRRSMAMVLAELNYRDSAWGEHEIIAARILSGDAAGAEIAAKTHALTAGQTTEEHLKAQAAKRESEAA
ncbi:MAG TPA: FCD domain-containing protein, partial [Afipia sp.]